MKIESKEGFVDVGRVSIRKINKNVAKDMIVKNHYSHAWSLCTYALGIFYKTDKDSAFFEEKEDKLIGCVIYGTPVGRTSASTISSTVKPEEVLELTRLWIADGYGKNIESYCISKSFDWIRSNDKTIKVILSFADPEQNHQGKIYQATNFIFAGLNSDTTLMPNFSVSLTGPNDVGGYKWIHSRTTSSKWGSVNVEHLKKQIGRTFYRKKESGKYKYIYFLGNKKEKREFIKNMNHPPLPYPKACDFSLEIEKIEVKEKVCPFLKF